MLQLLSDVWTALEIPVSETEGKSRLYPFGHGLVFSDRDGGVTAVTFAEGNGLCYSSIRPHTGASDGPRGGVGLD